MVKRLKKEEKIERKKEIKKIVLLFLEEKKGRRFTYSEIAAGIEVKPIQKYQRGVSITDNGNILNEVD